MAKRNKGKKGKPGRPVQMPIQASAGAAATGQATGQAGGQAKGSAAPRGGTRRHVELGELEGFAADRLDWGLVRELFESQASSSLGRRALRELEPREDADAIAALARVAELMALEGASPPLADLTDPLPMLHGAVAERRALSSDDLTGLLDFLRAITRIAGWLDERRASCPQNAALMGGLPDLSILRNLLENGLDGRGNVRDEASGKLSKLRGSVRRLTQEVERKAKGIANRPEYKGAFADGQMGRVHLRDGRPVLAVKAKGAGRVRGLVHDRSSSGETLFVEPSELIEAGNELAGAKADESREVNRLLVEWTRAALDRLPGIEGAADRLADFELAVIGERFAAVHGGRPAELPEIPDDGAMVLREARHPLLSEQARSGVLERCIPIDLRLGDPFDILVITGPNTGGKTLALKTAGLFALLTRLGLPITAARGSVVPLYRGIVADIGDEQEVQQSLSTFSSHLKRIADGLPQASPRTLFLLDELGGGTDPADGAALGAALLEWLRVRRVPTLASTHIGRLKEYAYRHARVENANVEFDLETLRPLYTLIVGAPGESRALAIAARLGFDPAILQAAAERVERPTGDSQKLMDDMRDARLEAERSRSAADDRLDEVEQLKAQLEETSRMLADREKMLVDEAQLELDKRLARVRQLLERGAKLSAQLAGEHRRSMEGLFGELAESVGAASLTDARASFLGALKKGDFVWVPRFKKRCPVLRLDRDRGKLRVRLGNQELELAFDDVSALESA